jgi:hypothetical protein
MSLILMSDWQQSLALQGPDPPPGMEDSSDGAGNGERGEGQATPLLPLPVLPITSDETLRRCQHYSATNGEPNDLAWVHAGLGIKIPGSPRLQSRVLAGSSRRFTRITRFRVHVMECSRIRGRLDHMEDLPLSPNQSRLVSPQTSSSPRTPSPARHGCR